MALSARPTGYQELTKHWGPQSVQNNVCIPATEDLSKGHGQQHVLLTSFSFLGPISKKDRT